MEVGELKIVKGMIWNFFSYNSVSFFQLVFGVILARILAPETFGIFTMAISIIFFVSLLLEAGLGHPIIQGKHEIEKMANFMFLNGLIISLFFFVCLYAIAPFFAKYFMMRDLVFLLRVLGFSFVLYAFYVIQRCILLKRLEFRTLFFINNISLFFSSIFAIILALLGKGVWALAGSYIIDLLIKVILLWSAAEWKPSFRYDFKIARKMLYFGGYASSEAILGWFINGVDKVILGRFLGLKLLGVYNIGYNFAMTPLNTIVVPFNTALYPAFCTLQENINEFRKYYLQYLSWIIFLMYPACLLIFFLCPHIIIYFLGVKWIDSIVVVRCMIIQCFIASLVTINHEIFRALNRPDIPAKFLLVRIIFTVPVYFYYVRFGLLQFCLGFLGLSLIFAPFNAFLCSKKLQMKRNELWGFLRSFVVIANLLLTISIVILNYFFRHSWISLFSYLFLICAVLGFYAAGFFFVEKEKMEKLKILISNFYNNPDSGTTIIQP